MPEFGSIREAKDFLADRIAAKAEREGTPLTEVERKMLYFSESGWTLPEMAEVSAEFDRDYNQDEYEKKIAELVRKIQGAPDAKDQQELQNWDRALRALSREDHYLLVLVGAAGAIPEAERRTQDGPRSTGRTQDDWLRPWLIALGLALGAVALIIVLQAIFATR